MVSLLMVLSVMMFRQGHAEAVVPAQTLYDSSVLVTSANVNVQKLDIGSAGTLTVELKDMKFPDFMNTLSFNLTSATKVIEPTHVLDSSAAVRDQSWSIQLSGPATLYAAIFAKPQDKSVTNPFAAGMYYAKISFVSATAPVPLPAAFWLLISGISGLIAVRPKHKLSQTAA